MKTYLKIMFTSDGSAPSDIITELIKLGFKAIVGYYDFEYDWGKDDVDINELIYLADKIHSALDKNKAFFTMETN